MTEKLIYPCQHCGSASVRKRGTDTKPDPAGGMKGIVMQIWHCRDCGKTYRTPIDEDHNAPTTCTTGRN